MAVEKVVQRVSAFWIVVDFDDFENSRWQTVNAIIAIGIGAHENGSRVSKRVHGNARFGTESSHSNQNVGDSIFVGVENTVVVFVVENMPPNRGRSDFFEVEICGRSSSQWDADPGDNIFVVRGIVLNATGLGSFNRPEIGSNIKEVVRLYLDDLVFAWRQPEFLAERVVSVGVGGGLSHVFKLVGRLIEPLQADLDIGDSFFITSLNPIKVPVVKNCAGNLDRSFD